MTCVYDLGHLTVLPPCANLARELNIHIGGANGESRFNAGAVPQLYFRWKANCTLQAAIHRESQKTRIRQFSTTFEVKGVGTSAVSP
jgi:hypothetical protein